MERWSHPSASRIIHNHHHESEYNAVDDQKEYEDVDYYYGRQSDTSARSTHKIVKSPSVPPPPMPPPMTSMGTMGRGIPATHLAIHTPKSKKSSATSRWKILCGALVLTSILLLLLVTIVAFLVLGIRTNSFFKSHPVEEQQILFPVTKPQSPEIRGVDAELSANHLLTLLITKRKICLFEASTDDEQSSLKSFMAEHIESAQLLFYGNLSHAGVPVHPLQFQRVLRGMGVDSDCHVVIYDRGYVIWSTYAMWIFKLYGHNRVSVLAGGFDNWKTLQLQSQQYRTERGPGQNGHMGNIVGSWNSSLISTYDDLLANTESDHFDLIDAQTKDEYSGRASGALFGHIRGALNLPIEAIFDWNQSKWLTSDDLISVFKLTGITRKKPVIVYCSTSVRASMVWWLLSREGFETRLYFGGWPEWLVRAPDYLKVLPQ